MTRIKNWTGTVHYADHGLPACGPCRTHSSWLAETSEPVTCKRCIALAAPVVRDPESWAAVAKAGR